MWASGGSSWDKFLEEEVDWHGPQEFVADVERQFWVRYWDLVGGRHVWVASLEISCLEEKRQPHVSRLDGCLENQRECSDWGVEVGKT